MQILRLNSNREHVRQSVDLLAMSTMEVNWNGDNWLTVSAWEYVLE